MYIIAEVIWWLLLIFGCCVAVLGIAVVVKGIQDIVSLNKSEEDPSELVEMVKKFGTLVEDKYYEAKETYSYDEDDLKMVVNTISNKVPDET